MPKQKVVFLCKGSRGDVLPLLSIALELVEGCGVHVVVVCAKSSLNDQMRQLLQRETYRPIELRQLPEFGVHRRDKNEAEEATEHQTALRAEVEIALEASRGADLIIYNLFSLEGQFISRGLDVPSIAVSPHLQMRPVPAGFKTQLSKSHPSIYQRLMSCSKGWFGRDTKVLIKLVDKCNENVGAEVGLLKLSTGCGECLSMTMAPCVRLWVCLSSPSPWTREVSSLSPHLSSMASVLQCYLANLGGLIATDDSGTAPTVVDFLPEGTLPSLRDSSTVYIFGTLFRHFLTCNCSECRLNISPQNWQASPNTLTPATCSSEGESRVVTATVSFLPHSSDTSADFGVPFACLRGLVLFRLDAEPRQVFGWRTMDEEPNSSPQRPQRVSGRRLVSHGRTEVHVDSRGRYRS
ncbi:hypothetical protein GBAR_LOCUS1856 [Geodia barretti]|uniref:Glycosyltransferase n=1 Tax=Geodia barretti TaxID=519541 RepID=A0AA35VWU2_GEOBA|nr:hypothetical protein GBAR_LOCUS1856 [Geodia barretti]